MSGRFNTSLRSPVKVAAEIFCLSLLASFVFWFFLVALSELDAMQIRPALMLLMPLLAGVLSFPYGVIVAVPGLIVGAGAILLLRRFGHFSNLLTMVICSAIAMVLSGPAMLVIPDADGHPAVWSYRFLVIMALSGAAMGQMLWMVFKNAFVGEDE